MSTLSIKYVGSYNVLEGVFSPMCKNTTEVKNERSNYCHEK